MHPGGGAQVVLGQAFDRLVVALRLQLVGGAGEDRGGVCVGHRADALDQAVQVGVGGDGAGEVLGESLGEVEAVLERVTGVAGAGVLDDLPQELRHAGQRDPDGVLGVDGLRGLAADDADLVADGADLELRQGGEDLGERGVAVGRGHLVQAVDQVVDQLEGRE
ncbi:hypothetical protein [Actinoplanes sp. L3-i22]|uniref:hypothetical protein n=1 Tax=Actinoplanes sp. L3-i22 TaxID=2836373 RepID=UPI001C85553C|nr:hypothetical protein [Actinoplanes sp. L3-i22]